MSGYNHTHTQSVVLTLSPLQLQYIFHLDGTGFSAARTLIKRTIFGACGLDLAGIALPKLVPRDRFWRDRTLRVGVVTQRYASYPSSSFHSLEVVITKPMTDLCWTCQQNSSFPFHIPHLQRIAAPLRRRTYWALGGNPQGGSRSGYTTRPCMCFQCRENIRSKFTQADKFTPPYTM